MHTKSNSSSIENKVLIPPGEWSQMQSICERLAGPSGTVPWGLMLVSTVGRLGTGEWLWPQQPWWVKAHATESMHILHSCCQDHFSLIAKAWNVFTFCNSLKGLGKNDVTHLLIVWSNFLIRLWSYLNLGISSWVGFFCFLNNLIVVEIELEK